MRVLNLVINGLPSIRIEGFHIAGFPAAVTVLNLVINGLPSIPLLWSLKTM